MSPYCTHTHTRPSIVCTSMYVVLQFSRLTAFCVRLRALCRIDVSRDNDMSITYPVAMEVLHDDDM
jgi:hypothetical protein